MCEKAFSTLKSVLIQRPILSNPDFQKAFILQTDASDRSVGAVLSKLDGESNDQPVAFLAGNYFHGKRNTLQSKRSA